MLNNQHTIETPISATETDPSKQSGLSEKHWAELMRSAISPDIANRNFRTIDDSQELDRILNRNADRKWQHSDDLVPGWLVSGVDPETDESTLLGCQYKPDLPPLQTDGDGNPKLGKFQKYIGASQFPAAPLFLDTGDSSYWQRVKDDRAIPICLTEGGKKAAAALSNGWATIALTGVANGQKQGRINAQLKRFCQTGRLVNLIFDNDLMTNPNVQAALDKLGRLVSVEGAIVRVVLLPEGDAKGLDDFIADHGKEALDELIEDALTFEEWRKTIGNKDAKEEKVSNATRLHRLVDAQCEVWQTPDRVAWVDVPIGNHHESMPLESKPFKMWLSEQFYRAHDRYIGQDALSQVLCVLAGKAMQADEYEIHHRSALVDGKVYLDLGRKDWKIVEVSDTGWRIVTHCPAKFWRPNSMKALPLPIEGGDWQDLKLILNLEEKDWVLLLTWLSFGFFPQTPHPLLILNGEQGTGKSKASELLKRLIDPSKALLMSLPRDERNLKAHAANRSVLVYDNLSGLSNEMSDALCRLATGGGLVDRMLYSDMEESVFDGVRPIVLNGIEALASRPDLLERSVLLNLPVITDDQRITEAQWERTLSDIQPAVLGCLLSAVAQGLAHKDNLHLMSLPRMADFAVWGHAVEGAFGFAPGSFDMAYSANRRVVHDAALDNDLVASAIRDLIAIRGEWTGTATELMIELTKLLPEQVARSPEWIRSPRGLGRRLPRLAPELRRAGIEVKTGIKIGGQRVITIGKVAEVEPVSEEAPIEIAEEVVFANGCYPDLIFTVVELIGGSMLKVKCAGYQEATYPANQMRRHQQPMREEAG